MSNVMKISPCMMKHLQITKPLKFNKSLQMKLDSFSCNFSMQSSKIYLASGEISVKGKAVSSYSEEGSSVDNLPVSIELETISSETQFDRVIADAQQLEQSVVIVWMASWCRKCIYLKPKLEKLAADYYPSIRFYCVDVNKVPHKLVVRAEVTKMPTIQLWKDGKKQDEVIGGHKAYLVVNEVREMIDNEDSL